VRAQVSVNGERRAMELCDEDYRKLARRQGRSASPLESLFGSGSLFDEFFGDSGLGGSLFDRLGGQAGGDDAGDRIPPRAASRRGQGGVSIADRPPDVAARAVSPARRFFPASRNSLDQL
jgi:ATP-dependent Clp protease ATP-binding subunit ClpC